MDASILKSLQNLPESFKYVAVNGTKSPYINGWQDSRLNLNEFWQNHQGDTRCHAVGFLTGEPSGGVISLDHDGQSCDPLIDELSGVPRSKALPKTIAVTSGRPGRFQAFYRVDEQFWPYVSSKVIKTGTIAHDGKPEQLEFRWNRLQSVLVGAHPETGSYKWVEGCSPSEVMIADCPLWVLRQIVRFDLGLPRDRKRWSDRDSALSYLSAIPPSENYDSWLRIGMALKSVDEGLLDAFELWSSLAQNYDEGECEKKWHSFRKDGIGIGTLAEIAKENGWRGKDREVPKTGKESLSNCDDGYVTYIAKIEQLKEISDPTRRDYEVWQYAKSLNCSPRQIEKAITYSRPKSDKSQVIFNLDEFLNSASDGLEWLVPEILPKGESIVLAAIPKVGKTLLAVDLAYAIATGGEFLSEKLDQGRVLIVSTDESPNSTARKLTQRGFRTTDNNVRVMTRFLIQDTAPLEAELTTFKPHLVIIDSLKSVCRNSDISENSAEFANAIYDLKELLTEHGASGVLIHHEVKSKDVEGITKVRGSGAITGATWGIWQMSTKKGQSEDGESVPSGDRTLLVTSRDAEGFSTTIKLDPDDFSWSRELSTEEQDTRNNQQKILDLLQNSSPNGLEKREIDNQLNLGKDSLNKTLSRLVEKRLITKRPSETNPRSNVYAYPISEGDNKGDKGVTRGDNNELQEETISGRGGDKGGDRLFYTKNENSEIIAERGFQETVRGGDKPVSLKNSFVTPTEKRLYYIEGDKGGDNRGDKGVTRETGLNGDSPISVEELPDDYMEDLI